MERLEEADEDEKKIILYLLGTSLSYIVLVGGLLVFILLLIDVSRQILTAAFSAYLTFTFALLTTYLHRPLQKFGLKKLFLGGSGFFLLISILFFLKSFSIL